MELKPGYKQTEVGIIPNEWDVVSIGSLIFDYRGGASLKPSDFTSTGVKVLPKGGVGRTGWLNVAEDEQKYCSPEYAANNYRNQVDESYTIVVLRDLVPSGPSIGLIVRIRDRETYVLAQGVYGFKVNEKAVPGYLVHLSNTSWYRKLSNSIMVGSTQVHITNTAYKKVLIPLPPRPEQETIAAALSDADALIEALEQLIAKKYQVKQGTMQELLTGKRRLPGFSGEWEVKTFGDLFNISGGLSASRDQLSSDGHGHCYLHYGDIHMSTKTFVDVQAEFQDIPKLNIPLKKVPTASLLEDGDVVFVDASEDDEGASRHVVIANPNKIPYISGSHTIVAKSKTDELDHDFRRYCFQTSEVKKQFLFYAVGTKVSGISKTNIAKINLPAPPTPEQTAIAEILSDMDTEIAALETKLTKARQVKQGMMQELLTGRIRLV